MRRNTRKDKKKKNKGFPYKKAKPKCLNTHYYYDDNDKTIERGYEKYE